jgi:hypothetical protein
VWKLVGYDDAPAHANVATRAPAINITRQRNEDTSPPEKG